MTCKYCGLSGHSRMMCYARPKNKMLARRTMRNIGKYGRKWLQTRAEWIRENPAPWHCYICGDYLTKDTLTLDHLKSRSRHPELRYEKTNLKPCCYACNKAKGSRNVEDIHGRN